MPPMRTLRPPAITLCIAAFAAALTPAWGQYVWRDKSGRTNYSDLPPPPDVPDKNIVRRPAAGVPVRQPVPAVAAAAAASAAASAASGPRGVDAEIESRRARAEQEKAARAKADEERAAAQRAENCQRARQQLAMLDSGQRVARVDGSGARVVLDDDARAAEAVAVRRVIDSDCR